MIRRAALASAVLLALVGAGCNGPAPPAPDPRHVEAPSDKPADKAPDATAVKPVEKPSDKPPEKPPPDPTPGPSPNPAVMTNKEAGVVSGVVRRDDGPDGGLADAVVWVADPPPASAAIVPSSDLIKITLRKGEYRPHVSAIRVGAQVQLASLDADGDFFVSGAAAFSRTLAPGETASFPVPKAGIVVIGSQVHPERPPAYLHVFPHAYFAVTGTDGKFRLPALPPGEYEIVFWYEGRPKQRTERVKVKLEPGTGAAVEWTVPVR
jgi:hypothetical protein